MSPLTFREFDEEYVMILAFDEYHGTKFRKWTKYYDAAGRVDSPEDDYQNYLRWFALKDSPLMKALT